MNRLCRILKVVRAKWFGSSRQHAENTVTQQATKPNPEKPISTCHHCKKPGYTGTSVVNSRKGDQKDTNKKNADNIINSTSNSGQTTSNTHNNETVTNGNANSASNRNDRKPKNLYPLCETCGKTNYSTEKAILDPMQQTDRLLG